MNNKFKKWDFIYHTPDKVSGIIISDILTEPLHSNVKASTFWEDGVFNPSFTWNSDSDTIKEGKPFDFDVAHLLSSELNMHVQMDNLTFIEMLNAYKDYLNE